MSFGRPAACFELTIAQVGDDRIDPVNEHYVALGYDTVVTGIEPRRTKREVEVPGFAGEVPDGSTTERSAVV